MKVHLLLACLSVAVLSACQTEPADVPGAVRVGTYNIRHCRSRGQLIDKLDGENFWDRRGAPGDV